MDIRPQPGPQEEFCASPADIVIYGGAAGGGKSYALLIDPLRDMHNPHFGAVIFRRTTTQVRNEGGLWDESEKIYPRLGAFGRRQGLRWKFPSGAKLAMAHMEHEKNRFDWMGSQIPYIGFDELTHFTAKQFWYMFSRNRSTSGVPGRIRGTCNPDPDSFVLDLIKWWIDQETGYAIRARSGVIRFFTRVQDELHFGDSRRELKEKFGSDIQTTSLTFILSSVYDNKILLEADPSYLAKLKAMPLVERLQLLGEGDKGGNWLIRPAAGLIFKARWFDTVAAAPADARVKVRFWDRAASKPTPSNPNPDWTAGVLMSRDRGGLFYIEDVITLQDSAHVVDTTILNTAKQDGKNVIVAYRQDPGSAGKKEAEETAKMLAGFQIVYDTVTGDKLTYAKPVSSQAEAGNIKIVSGKWNKSFLRVLENFDGSDKGHDDEVDGMSGAFDIIVNHRKVFVA